MARYVAEDPINAAVLGLRLIPGAVKRPVARGLLRATPRRLVTVRALAEWDLGARSSAMAQMRQASTAAPRRTRRRLARLALALGQTALAGELIRNLPPGDSRRRRLEALTAGKEGKLRLALARTNSDRPSSKRDALAFRRLRHQWESELAALDPDHRPTWPAPARPIVSVKDRVLHLVTNSLPHVNAGYTVRTHMIARAQKQLGLDPRVVTRLGFPIAQGVFRARDCDLVDEIPYYRLLPDRAMPALAAERLDLNIRLAAELVEDLDPAVLHAASNHVNAQIALALRDRYALPFVYEVRGFIEVSWLSRQADEAADTSDRYVLARELETYCMREADAVVTLGERMKDEIVARGVLAKKVLVVPNAVDDSFLAVPPDARRTREALGAQPGELIIGILSTFFPHEGIDHLVRATAVLRDRGAKVRLALIGDGSERASLERLVAELDLTELTAVTGRVSFSEVRNYYAAIDIFVVPRTDDLVCHMVTPLKPIEAMATATPVVASAVGGLTEIIEDGVTGILTRPEDSAALADAIEPLLYDDALRTRLGKAARDWVASDRTWSQNAERYRSLYRSLGAA